MESYGFFFVNWTMHVFWTNFGMLFPKLFQPTVRKNCSSHQEKLLKFETEDREFTKQLRSQEQFILTVQFLKQNTGLTCSRSFLRSNALEQLEFKLEKIIGI